MVLIVVRPAKQGTRRGKGEGNAIGVALKVRQPQVWSLGNKSEALVSRKAAAAEIFDAS